MFFFAELQGHSRATKVSLGFVLILSTSHFGIVNVISLKLSCFCHRCFLPSSNTVSLNEERMLRRLMLVQQSSVLAGVIRRLAQLRSLTQLIREASEAQTNCIVNLFALLLILGECQTWRLRFLTAQLIPGDLRSKGRFSLLCECVQ